MNGRRNFEYIQETSICKQNNFMTAINFISTLEMQKTRVTQKTKNWTDATSICNAALKTAMFWKKPKYKTQFTINTPIMKMLKKKSNINNLSCKKHRTHSLDLSFRRNNLKISLSALSKNLPDSSRNFWNFLPVFSRFSLTFQNINHISRFSRFSRLVWTMNGLMIWGLDSQSLAINFKPLGGFKIDSTFILLKSISSTRNSWRLNGQSKLLLRSDSAALILLNPIHKTRP